MERKGEAVLRLYWVNVNIKRGQTDPRQRWKNWNENWGNKWTSCMCMNAVDTAAMTIGSLWYWFWVDDHQIDVDTRVREIHGQTANIPPNYTVLAFHFYFCQSSPFIQKELIKPWVSSELGAGPVYGRWGGENGWIMFMANGPQRRQTKDLNSFWMTLNFAGFNF